MSYRVEFGGEILSNYCTILNVTREILPSRENYNKKIPNMHGSYYTGFSYEEKIITLEVAIVAISKIDYMQKIRKLAGVLDIKSPTRLFISDEPNLYSYAIPNGKVNLDKKKYTGSIEIEFVCHNPFAYSKRWQSALSDSRGVFTIENQGTADTNLYVGVNFKKPACFFQCTNPKGETVLIGKPKDETKSTTSIATNVVSDNCTSSSGFTSIAESLLDTNRKTTGHYGVGYNGNGIVCTNYGSGQENMWNGAGFKKQINGNISEFEVVVDFVFSSNGKEHIVPPTPPVPPPPPTPENPNPQPSYGDHRVTAKIGLNVRTGRGINFPIVTSMPYNHVTHVYRIENDWCEVKHNDKIGWCDKKYMAKVVKSQSSRENEYGERQLGILEIYGFDNSGAKLFKFMVSDTNEFYEFVQPQGDIGGIRVVDDNRTCPAPNKEDILDDDGKVTGNQEVTSGAFGDWNDFVGKAIVTRQKNGAGSYLWNITMYKYINGNLAKTLGTGNFISSSDYPIGDLNYLGFFIGTRNNSQPMDIVAITNIEVQRYNVNTDSNVETNLEIFKANDELQINFENGLVTLNGKPILTNIDIGTEFFTLPSGRSQVVCRTDDTSADIVCGFQPRFL